MPTTDTYTRPQYLTAMQPGDWNLYPNAKEAKFGRKMECKLHNNVEHFMVPVCWNCGKRASFDSEFGYARTHCMHENENPLAWVCKKTL